jgi:Ca2+-binding RTX toxin-like protein
MAIVTGTNASDPELEGTSLADQILGLGGNDILIGFDGDDELEGGAGADELFGSAGIDFASYRGSSSGVFVDINGILAGDASGDRLYSIEGLIGSAHADVLGGLNIIDERNVLKGDGGNDALYGRGGDDLLDGGTGADLLNGGSGTDELRGSAGADQLIGGEGGDQLRGGGGLDIAVYFSTVRVDLATGVGSGGDAEATASSASRACRVPGAMTPSPGTMSAIGSLAQAARIS